MITKVEGIVLSERAYSETSKIINLITKEYGVIGVLAKGAYRMKSELRSVTGKMTYGWFYLHYKEGKLSTLTSVDLIDNFKNIKTDINKISFASFLLDLTHQVMKQTSSSGVYDLLIASLIKINEGFDPLVITNILELKYLGYLGVMPVVDKCSKCGRKTEIVTISSYRGGYLCKNCRQNEKIVSLKTIKLIRMFYYVDIAKITTLNISAEVKKEINQFLDEYYDKYTGLYLKSKTFLNKLMKLDDKA